MDDDDCWERPSRPFRLIDLAVVFTTLVRDLTGDIAQACDSLAELAIGHANHRIDQKRFLAEAALEIESLIEGDSP